MMCPSLAQCLGHGKNPRVTAIILTFLLYKMAADEKDTENLERPAYEALTGARVLSRAQDLAGCSRLRGGFHI